MLTGVCPFDGNDKEEIYTSICKDIPEYPNWVNQEAKDILEKVSVCDNPFVLQTQCWASLPITAQ